MHQTEAVCENNVIFKRKIALAVIKFKQIKMTVLNDALILERWHDSDGENIAIHKNILLRHRMRHYIQ